MNSTVQSPLEIADQIVARARTRGADEAEVAIQTVRETSIDLQKDDIHNAGTAEETIYGLRLYRNGALGFATTNREEGIESLVDEALALAAATPGDPRNGLGDPLPLSGFSRVTDTRIEALDLDQLVTLARRMLDRVKARDTRVRIDSGGVSAVVGSKGLVSSRGMRLSEPFALASGNLFGMAVDGNDVGSFDQDGHSVVRADQLERELDAAADRFVIKTLGALGAKKSESFRGPVVLSPEVVRSFLLGNLLSILDGKAVRTGKCPYAKRLGEKIASPLLELVDDPHDSLGTASSAFDREGIPTRKTLILEDGVLKTFLYDVFEARAAGVAPTGHARGSAGGMPSIGVSNLHLRAGDQSFTRLCCDPDRAIVVTRFSGSCNPITGEFSGVVKGGFEMRRGERSPIKETLISGNLHEALLAISGLSAETRNIGGHSTTPAVRIDNISITAG